MNHPQLDQLEERAYRTVVDDGLLDILLSFLFLGAGIAFFTDVNIPGTEIDVALVLFGVLAYPLWRVMRSRVIEPRVGYVRLSPERRRRIESHKRTVVSLLVGFAVVLVVVSQIEAEWTRSLHSVRTILGAAMIGIPVVTAASLLRIRRWYGHAAILGVAAVVEYASGAPFGSGWLVAGAVVFVLGLLVLTAFLQRHSVTMEENGADV